MHCFQRSSLALITTMRWLATSNRLLVSNVDSASLCQHEMVKSVNKDNVLPGDNLRILPGVELARQVVNPIQAFSFKGDENRSLGPADPLAAWREYYSLEHGKPYYHNTETNATTFQIPMGFVTQYPLFYSKNGFHVDMHGAVHSKSKDTSNNSNDGKLEAQDGRVGLSLRQRLAAYGGGGLLLYLIVHNISFAVVFTCIYFFHIDLPGLARSYGFNISDKENDVAEEKKSGGSPILRTLLLSIVLNKILIPLHLALTIGTAPLLAHRLESITVRLIPQLKLRFTNFKN